MKKVISLFLSLMMLLSITAGLDFSAYALASSGKCGDNVTYAFDLSTGTLTISGTEAMTNYTYSNDSCNSPFYKQSAIKTVVINSGVTSIGNYAFYGCTGLKSVTIGNSVTSIGYDAFYKCTGLTSITIPDSVTSIGYAAFFGCTGLTSITIPDSVTSIGNSAFYGCTGLTSVTIPDSVTSIGNSAFYGCTGLTSVIIPDSVKSIGDYAFSGCTGLKELTMPCSIKISNSSYSFSDCINIEKVTLTKGTGEMPYYQVSSSIYESSNQHTPWYISRNNLKTLIIEEGVKTISSFAFYGCTGLICVKIPHSVTTCSNKAFGGCANIKELTIPCRFNTYYPNAFWDCTSIEKLTVLKGDYSDRIANYNTDGNVRDDGYVADNYNNYRNTPWYYSSSNLKTLIIEEGVTEIGNYAFYNCNAIKELTIPCSTKIYNSAYTFGGCANIEKLTLTKGTGIMQIYGTSTAWDSNVTNYKYTPWGKSCKHLKAIIIDKGVTNIGDLAFRDCQNINEIVIPASVTNIGTNAFSNCTNLEKLIILGDNTNIKNIINNLPENTKLYVAEDSYADSTASLNGKEVIHFDKNCSETGNHTASSESYIHNNPTCTKMGTTAYNCLVCGQIAIEETNIPANGHSWNNGKITTKPTCTETGIKTYTCSVCGDTYTNDIEAVGHRWTGTITTNPTCTEKGIRTYTCSTCGDSYTEEVSANGHAWNKGKITTAPTCTETGVIKYTCTVCGETYTETVKENGHSWDYGVPTSCVTCTENGSKHYTCTVCGVTKDETVPALGHSYVETYSSNGTMKYITCSFNGTVLDKRGYPESEHNYQNKTNQTWEVSYPSANSITLNFSNKTQTEKTYDIIYIYDGSGNQVGKYSGDELKSKSVTVNGDSLSIKLVTDEENQYYGFSFDSIVANLPKCDYYQEVEVSHHYIKTVVKELTCTQDGEYFYKCENCGDEYTEHINAKGHSVVNQKAVAPTCTKAGKTEGSYCSVCKEVFVQQTTVPALGHNYNNTVTNPTCTKAGYTTRACLRCGYTCVDSEVGALGHNYTVKITKATQSSNGKSVLSCTHCGDVLKTENISYIKQVNLSQTSTVYNGNKQKPLVKVLDGTGKKIASNNYTVTYSGACKNAGKYTVTIKFKGNYSGTIKKSFTVKPSIKLKQNHLFVGETATIVVGGAKKYKLTSNKKKVATVSKKGNLKAKKTGKVKITVKANGVKNTLVLKVEKPSPYLYYTDITLKKYDTLKLEVYDLPNGAKVSWKSDNKSVVSVNKKGKITANNIGDAKITATIKFNGKTYRKSCIVSVINRRSDYGGNEDGSGGTGYYGYDDGYDDYDDGDDYQPDNSARIAQLEAQISALEAQIQSDERQLSIYEMDTSGMYAAKIASLRSKIASERSQLQSLYNELWSLQ